MNNKRLKAEHVEHLYGVPRNERRLLREILNTTALYANRKVVDIRGLKTPEPGLIFGCTTEAENYGYIQRGDYLFSLGVPEGVIGIIVNELEALTPTCDIPPRELHNLRRSVMEDVNLIPELYKEKYSEKISYYKFADYLKKFSKTSIRENKFDLASLLNGLASQIEMAFTEEAKVLELRFG